MLHRIPIKQILLVASFTLALAACGPGDRIDATNGDTLKESLSRIATDMPQAERQRFGQDIVLVHAHAAGGIENVSRRDLYSPDYDMLFVGDSNTASAALLIFGEIFGRVALEAGAELDGKTPESLAQDALSIRSAYMENFAVEIEAHIASLQTELEQNDSRTDERIETYEQTVARIDQYEEQKSTVVQNFSLTSYSGPDNYVFEFEGLVDVTNYSESPVNGIGFRFMLSLPDYEGHYFQLFPEIDFDEPILPSETRRGVSFAITQSIIRPGVPTFGTTRAVIVAEGYDRVDIGRASENVQFNETPERLEFVYYTINYGRVDLSTTSEQQRILDEFEDTMADCEQWNDQILEVIAANEAFLENVRALVSNPQPFEGQVVALSRGFSFGPSC